MYSIILSPDELAYLSQLLQVKFGASSPLSTLNTVKLTAAKKKKVHESLLKGKAIIVDDASKTERVHTLATAALGILAAPETMIDLVITVPGGLQRRAYLGIKHTLLELIDTTNGTYIINLPMSEQIIRDFLAQHLRSKAVPEGSLKLVGPEIIVMSLLWRLIAKHPKGATADQIVKAAAKKEYTAMAFQGTWGALTAETATAALVRLKEQGHLTETEGKYLPTGFAAQVGAAAARERSMLITRIDVREDKHNVRTLSLVQGEEHLFVQTVIPGKQPVLAFTATDAATATGLVSLAVFSPDEFARQTGMPVKAPAPTAQASVPATKAKPSPEPTPVVTPVPTPAATVSPTTTAQASAPATNVAKPKAKVEPPAPETRKCPACQTDIPAAAKFCRACGANTEAAPAPTAPVIPVCSKCQAELKPGAKFCRACGTPVSSDAQPEVK